MLRITKFFGVLLAAIIISFAANVEASTDWNTNVIRVTGTGIVPPRAVSNTHAIMLAKRAAEADAYRLLAEAVNGVQVDSETTVEQLMIKSDVVKTKVSAVIRGARTVAEGEINGGYSVTMELPLFGGMNSLAETVIERPTYTEPFPAPTPSYTPPPAPPTTIYNPPTTIKPNPSYSGGYTGLIVDCRGVGYLRPVMSPVIFDANLRTIYGHKNLDYDKVIRDGMASYAQDMSQAYRAGDNPLVVRAIGIDDLNADPIISMEDTDLVLYENEISHFLDNTAVVFLY